MILFNLLLSTALLITTPDASGEYKHVQIPPTKHHAVKLAQKQQHNLLKNLNRTRSPLTV